MSQDTGGPAFPNRGDNTPDNPIYDGMTLLDYFAAHAPDEVPAWFDPEFQEPHPVMPDARELPPNLRRTGEEIARGNYVLHEDDPPEIIEFDRLMGEYRAQSARRTVRYRLYRLASWRWFYAVQMIEAKKYLCAN